MKNIKINFRLYPTIMQEQLLRQHAGAARYVWNYFLDLEQTTYQATGKFNFYNTNCLLLTQLKKTTPWLNESYAASLQQSLKHLNLALTQSLPKSKCRKGFPKFQKRKNFICGISLTMVNTKRNVDLENNTFRIPKIGDVKCKYHRAIPSDFSSCQIKQSAPGIWEVSLTCKVQEIPKQQINNSTGIDLNSKSFVLSDGTSIEIPKYLRDNQTQVKRIQRKLARAKKGSNNRYKIQRKLAKLHYRIKMKRLNYFHTLTSNLLDQYDLICIEDLNVKEIQKKFGGIIQDNGFGMFRQMLEYKAELRGKHISVISRWFPSSQLCNQCGCINKHSLSERTYKCQSCNMVLNRDHNAAINIQRVGITPEVTNYMVIKNACGTQLRTDHLTMIGQLLGDEAGSHAL